MIIFSFFHYKY